MCVRSTVPTFDGIAPYTCVSPARQTPLVKSGKLVQKNKLILANVGIKRAFDKQMYYGIMAIALFTASRSKSGQIELPIDFISFRNHGRYLFGVVILFCFAVTSQ